MKLFNQRYTIFSILLLVSIGLSCKKSPTDNFKLIIAPDVIKYSILLEIKDAANGNVIPKNMKIGFSGKDADHIYEISGVKKFKAVNGFLNIGLGPERTPTANDPAIFSVTVSADGYLPITQELSITAIQTAKVVKLKLINLLSPPAEMQILQQNISLVNGVVKGETFIKASASGTGIKRILSTKNQSINPSKQDYDEGKTNIVIPDGTTFYYNDWVITGSIVEYRKFPVKTDKVTLVMIGSKQQSTRQKNFAYLTSTTGDQISILNGEKIPQNQLLMKSAVVSDFLSNGYYRFIAEINGENKDVSIDGVNPIWYKSFVIDPATINPTTGNLIKAGDLIETGIDWRTGITFRTQVIEVIHAGGGKELRANAQGEEAGYYYKATYQVDYKYNFNTAYNGIEVADPENIIAFTYIEINANGSIATYPDEFNMNSGIHSSSGKIISFYPITTRVGYSISYWGKKYEPDPITTNNATIDVFTNVIGNHIKLEPLVTFDITNECTSKNRIYRVNGIAYIGGGGAITGIANIKNGTWSSNGLIQGNSYAATLYTNGIGLSFSKTINQTLIEEHRKNEYDVCNLYK